LWGPVSVDQTRPVDKNPLWNLFVHDRTLGERKSGPRALTPAQLVVRRQ
jgi:hypothetical protein